MPEEMKGDKRPWWRVEYDGCYSWGEDYDDLRLFILKVMGNERKFFVTWHEKEEEAAKG